jgi:hypothetical protein
MSNQFTLDGRCRVTFKDVDGKTVWNCFRYGPPYRNFPITSERCWYANCKGRCEYIDPKEICQAVGCMERIGLETSRKYCSDQCQRDTKNRKLREKHKEKKLKKTTEKESCNFIKCNNTIPESRELYCSNRCYVNAKAFRYRQRKKMRGNK